MMTAIARTPKPDEISKFFTSLFGMTIGATEVGLPKKFDLVAVADYVNHVGEVRGVLACDLPCAAKLSAALTQIPSGAVEDAVAAGSLPENLIEILGEVFNISVNLFPESLNQRLLVRNVITGKPAAAMFANDFGHATKAYFQLAFPRYGTGVLCVATQ